MARMLPNFINPDVRSNAERKLFERFRTELDDGYIVIHSLGLARHSNKLRGEIDFTVLCSEGVLCVEVKGGIVERDKSGLWHFINRYGEISVKHESPFDQASSGMFELRKSILNEFGHQSIFNRIVFGYGNFFPDIPFNKSSPDSDPERVADQVSLTAPLSIVIKNILDYSRNELVRIYGQNKTAGRMSKQDIDKLIQFLRGYFTFIPRLGSIISGVAEELVKLTSRQVKVLAGLDSNPRLLVTGRAGTGKTLLAMEQARRQAAAGKHVAYICFNKLLAAGVRWQLKMEVDSGKVMVSTLHSYADKIISEAGLQSELSGYNGTELFMVQYPRVFEEACFKSQLLEEFDLLIVDEGQDLRYQPYFNMLEMIIKGGIEKGCWVWFEDPEQCLFNWVDPEYACNPQIYNPTLYTLNENCRNTAPIGNFIACSTGIEIDSCNVTTGENVKIEWYESEEAQIKRLSNMTQMLLGENVKPVNLIILTSCAYQNSVLNNVNKLAGLPLVPYEYSLDRIDCIRHATVHSFKGLDSQAVIVTDIQDLMPDSARIRNYVAFSRAMAWLGLLIKEDQRKQMMEFADRFGEVIAKKWKNEQCSS